MVAFDIVSGYNCSFFAVFDREQYTEIERGILSHLGPIYSMWSVVKLLPVSYLLRHKHKRNQSKVWLITVVNATAEFIRNVPNGHL